MTPLIRSVPTPEPQRESAEQPAAPSWDCLAALVAYVAKLQRDGEEAVRMALAQYDETRGKLNRAVQREAHHIDHRARSSGDEVRERLVGRRG